MSGRAPRLLAISDRRLLEGESLVEWGRRLSQHGVDTIQLREKDLTDQEIFELACRLRREIPRRTRLLVNGRLDLALAAGAEGVHLPAAGVPTAPLRKRFGSAPLIGRSTHHPCEVEQARREGADYVTFGPVYRTPGKERFGPPPGLSGLRRAASLGLPVLALGGVTIDRLTETAGAGAVGIAGIRLFHDRPHLGRLLQEADRSFPRLRP